MRNFYILIFAIPLFNCSGKKENLVNQDSSFDTISANENSYDTQNENKSSIAVIDSMRINKNYKDIDTNSIIDSFKKFFIKFGMLSDFQKERIKFPLEKVNYDPYDESINKYYIEKEEWNFINFSNDSLAHNNSVDKFEIKLKIQENGVVYIRQGIDNGIYMSFHFIKENNKWYLKSIKDESF